LFDKPSVNAAQCRRTDPEGDQPAAERTIGVSPPADDVRARATSPPN
jgi:hypothetical protein